MRGVRQSGRKRKRRVHKWVVCTSDEMVLCKSFADARTYWGSALPARVLSALSAAPAFVVLLVGRGLLACAALICRASQGLVRVCAEGGVLLALYVILLCLCSLTLASFFLRTLAPRSVSVFDGSLLRARSRVRRSRIRHLRWGEVPHPVFSAGASASASAAPASHLSRRPDPGVVVSTSLLLLLEFSSSCHCH